MWNYAQHFAMSDNSYGTTFGPSTPGVINLVSGQTNGVVATLNGTGDEVSGRRDGSLTMIGDADPMGDVCSSSTRAQGYMGSKNIGDLLTAAGVSWGGVHGRIQSQHRELQWNDGMQAHHDFGGDGRDGKRLHSAPLVLRLLAFDRQPGAHPAEILAEIGHGRPGQPPVRHCRIFTTAAAIGNLPAVSFLKAPGYQDGHAGYSDPLDEQTFVVKTINFLEGLPTWKNTAVVILYDDSDGWYDHQMGPIVNQSTGPSDALTGAGTCGTAATSLPGYNPPANLHALGRCGYGPTTASARDLSMGEGELCRPYRHRPDFGDPLHRRQLAGRTAHRPRVFRRDRQLDHPDVRFHAIRIDGYLFLSPSTGEKVF